MVTRITRVLVQNASEAMACLATPYVSKVRAKAAGHQKLSNRLASDAALLIFLQQAEPFIVVWKLSWRWRPTRLWHVYGWLQEIIMKE